MPLGPKLNPKYWLQQSRSSKSLFKEEGWLNFFSYYKDKYKVMLHFLPLEACMNVWKTTINIVCQKDLFQGMKYVLRIQSLPEASCKEYKLLQTYHNMQVVIERFFESINN